MWRFIRGNNSGGFSASEKRIVLLVSAIFLLNELDFQMVMPLGADFARGLGIPASRIGWITGVYAISEFVSAVAGARLLNSANPRFALAVSLWGLAVSTALAGFSFNYTSLIISRIAAGLFGGPSFALACATLTDHIPEKRRGRAMGITTGVYSVVGVIGIPIGLKLAEIGNWRIPFFVIAALSAVLIPFVMRSMSRTTKQYADPIIQIETLTHGTKKFPTLLAFALNFISLYSNFLLVPSVAAYLQLNLGYPRDHLSELYAIGGCCTFFTMRLVGRWIDKFGTRPMILIVAPLAIANYYALYIHYWAALPVTLLFVTGAIFGSSRYIVVSTETSKVPPPDKRAGFMSLMNAAQALGQSTGAFTASLILAQTGPDLPLRHMPRVGCLAALVSACVPALLIWLSRMNKRRAAFAPRAEMLI